MTEPSVSPCVVEQRIRNRLMEWLEAVSGYESDPTSGGLNAFEDD